MADNYLEKRYEEVFGSGASRKTVVKRVGESLDRLLLKNRSHRSFDPAIGVTPEQLRRIISVNSKLPSARNQQVLRFRPVTEESEVSAVLRHIRLGAALPELHLPPEGQEPKAYIVVCSTAPEGRYVDIDLGISIQSMLLKTVEMGLNGICICAFERAAVIDALHLPFEPLAILAIGRGADKIRLVPIHEGDSQHYYRTDEGVHCVPKLQLDDLIIGN
jgi:nitroreductase